MNGLRFIAFEAWAEIRAGLRGPLVPITFVTLAVYTLLVVMNADYMREMGAAGMPLNSPHVIYLFVSGQALWLYFAWAWLFGQIIVRDRTAMLHEVVLASPVSLRALLGARYLGAVLVGCLLGTSILAGFTLVPVLSAFGVIRSADVVPVPLFAYVHGFVLFIIPGSIGMGALYTWAATKTRSVGGPFAAATVVVVIWMISMIALRGGGTFVGLATVLDPSGYGEVETQTSLWTPREKESSALAMTLPLLANRVIWLVLPLVGFVVSLLRLKREQLVLEKDPNWASARAAGGPWRRLAGLLGHRPAAGEVAGLPTATAGEAGALGPLVPSSARSWLRVAWNEAVWHLGVSVRGWGLLLAGFLLMAMFVGSSIVNVGWHSDGPFLPRSWHLLPIAAEQSYVVVAFMIAGFVGVMARRDDRPGFGEVVDATPAPLGTRIAGRAMAALGLTLALTLLPAVSAWIVMALMVPDALSWADPLLYFGVVMGPAILELCALTVAVHALIRKSGPAHAIAMILVFVAIINHELSLIGYRSFQFGIPVHEEVSAASGWSPWLAQVLTGNALKLGFVGIILALAWLAWPRGTDLHAMGRLRTAMTRMRTGGGRLALASAAVLVASGMLLHQKVVVEGGYQSLESELASDAAWEQRWWNSAGPYSVRGGEVAARVDPRAQRATVTWRIVGVQAAGNVLRGSLPHGAEITGAAVDGSPVEPVSANDQFEIPVAGCADTGCEARLELTVEAGGWPSEGNYRWAHASGVWLRAEDVLPSLGHDPGRLLHSPVERAAHGLDVLPGAKPAAALAHSAAVAPAGHWRWSVEFQADGFHTEDSGVTSGPLDFAVAWWPGQANRTEAGPLVALHAPDHSPTAAQVLQDLQEMRACVSETLGATPVVTTVLQAPRNLGEPAVHGELLWLPENEGWDVVPNGHGHWQRRARIARALASRALVDQANLRKEPGFAWLRTGVAGWIGLECIRDLDGIDAWVALQNWASRTVDESFGAVAEPVGQLGSDGDANWVEAYAPLAMLGWAGATGERDAIATVSETVALIAAGTSLYDALAVAAGGSASSMLLGAPAASDIVVERGQGSVAVDGTRWRWADGGWQPVSMPVHVVRRMAGESGEPRSPLGPLPTAIETADEPFVLIDAWPAFDRMPADNVWHPDR